jgi:hypothetical protein
MAVDGRGLEVAVLVGLQAASKSASYRQRLATDHALVSKDLFPRAARNKQRRQMRLVEEALTAGTPVAGPGASRRPPTISGRCRVAVSSRTSRALRPVCAR